MKTKFTLAFSVLVILMLCSCYYAGAQSWVLGGNSLTKDTSFGSKTNYTVKFITNNTERMRISNVGTVGIGSSITSRAQLTVGTGVGNTSAIFGGAYHGISMIYDNPTIGFNNYYNSGQKVINTGYSGIIQVNTSSGQMYFSLAPSGAKDATVTPSPKMTILQSGNIGIGTTSPVYKLEVEGGSTSAIYGSSTGSYGVYGNAATAGVYGAGGYYGVQGYAPGGSGYGYGVSGSSSYTGVTGSGGSYGVSGYCTSTSSGFGVYGQATDNASGIGVYGTGYYGVKAISNTLYGIDGTGYYIGVIGHGSTTNTSSFGVEGYGNTNGTGGYFTGGHNGVQGYASVSSSSNYGVYGSGNGIAYAGYFSGTVYATTYTGSDRKLKKNIEDVSTGLNIIKQLHPKMYEFRQDGNYQYMHLPEGKHYGLIAQELEQVLPNLIKDTKFDTRFEVEAQQKANANGAPEIRKATPQGEVIDFKAVNYTELIPIVVKAVQELDGQNTALKTENETLKNQIQDLQTRLSKIEAAFGKSSSSSFSLSSYLEVAVPNPSSISTTIKYHVPANAGNATLLMIDAKGSVVKQLSLNKGNSQLLMNTSALASGTYTYALYIDGVQADSKKMVVAR